MTRPILIAALLTSTAGMAYAAGPEPVIAPVVVAEPIVPFWAGGYAGIQLGYAYSEFDLGDIDNLDDDSFIGGINLGYLWEVSPGFYLGPEFQYDWADISVTDAEDGDTASFEEIARLKLILGTEVGTNGFFYGSAGVAYASFDSIGDAFDGFDGDETNYVVGFGYDYRVGDNWTVGGEYQFHHFNNVGNAGEDVDVNTVHIKASYRF
jgi:outer membrane immunogenic protein